MGYYVKRTSDELLVKEATIVKDIGPDIRALDGKVVEFRWAELEGESAGSMFPVYATKEEAKLARHRTYIFYLQHGDE